MLIIGELINTSGKKVREAIARRDAAFIRELARRQEEAGADYIDISVAGDSTDPSRETEDMKWAVAEVMQETELPLSIDTTDSAALAAGLERSGKGTFINSISAEESRMKPFMEIAAVYGCPAVVMPVRNVIPETADERVKLCHELAEQASVYGMAPENLYFDPLVLPVGVSDSGGAVALETLRGIKRIEGVKTTVGLSNISFGLPGRELLNTAFLIMALQAGLDSVIMNPLQKGPMAALLAGKAVLGRDRMCLDYISSYRRGMIG